MIRALSCQTSTSDTLSAATISTTETAFATTYTLPANLLATNKGIRISLGLLFTTSGTAPTKTLRLRVTNASGTVFYTSEAANWNNSLTNISIGATFMMLGAAAPSASSNTITFPVGVGSGGGGILGRNNTAQPVALATNASIVIVLTLQYSANTPSNTTTLQSLCVETIN